MLKTVFPTHFRSRCWKKGCQYPQHKDNIACYIEVGGATKIMGVYTTFSGIFFSFVMGGEGIKIPHDSFGEHCMTIKNGQHHAQKRPCQETMYCSLPDP